jgi:hypothetical protein
MTFDCSKLQVPQCNGSLQQTSGTSVQRLIAANFRYLSATVDCSKLQVPQCNGSLQQTSGTSVQWFIAANFRYLSATVHCSKLQVPQCNGSLQQTSGTSVQRFMSCLLKKNVNFNFQTSCAFFLQKLVTLKAVNPWKMYQLIKYRGLPLTGSSFHTSEVRTSAILGKFNARNCEARSHIHWHHLPTKFHKNLPTG